MKIPKDKKTRVLGRMGRVILVQVVPFVLMLILSSWLTLQAGQLIEKQRNANVTVQLTQF